MNPFTPIDLSQLPAPPVIEALSFESILQTMKDDFQTRSPDIVNALDFTSEPIVKLLEVCAYRELLLRQRINNAAKATMLAYAQAADLDNLAALFGVQRALINAGDPQANPPIPATYEDDARLRSRVQLSLQGHSTAGPIGSYVFHALSASTDVKDVTVASPSPGQVLITLLSTDNDGTPSQALLEQVASKLNAEEVRPLTDQVTVQAATVSHYQLQATLTLHQGPDTEVVTQRAFDAASQYVTGHHKLGHDITLSGLYAALHQSGVQNVQLTSPTADISNNDDQAAWCSQITLNIGGKDA